MHVYATRVIPPGFELQERLKLIAAERPHLARLIRDGAEYEERSVSGAAPAEPSPPELAELPEPPAEVIRSAPAPMRVEPRPIEPTEPTVDHSANLVAEIERRLSMTPAQQADEDARKAVEDLFPEPPKAA